MFPVLTKDSAVVATALGLGCARPATCAGRRRGGGTWAATLFAASRAGAADADVAGCGFAVGTNKLAMLSGRVEAFAHAGARTTRLALGATFVVALDPRKLCFALGALSEGSSSSSSELLLT